MTGMAVADPAQSFAVRNPRTGLTDHRFEAPSAAALTPPALRLEPVL